MQQAELAKILAAHKEWAESDGAKGSRAYLRHANLRDANLRGAYLSRANLSRAGLSRAGLSRADLSRANLSGADLSRADLRDAYLRDADLRDAYLSRALGLDPNKLRPVFWIIPEVGQFIGWKKLRDGVVAKVLIPDRAKRTCSLEGRKCRAEYVKTIALFKNGKAFRGPGLSCRDKAVEYRVGKITRPDAYDDSPLVQCSLGIHFFITRQEAEEYGE